MPARDPTTGTRRRGRPPRRRPSGRRTPLDADAVDRVRDHNRELNDTGKSGAESDPEEFPRGRVLRKRGRSKQSTPMDELDTKRQKENDETFTSNAESETDEAGEQKIDKQGRLLGGRVYKVPTFTLPTRGEQVLMFAMEPAKLLSYRDSYLFFQKNPLLERVRLTEEERNWLVDKRLLVHWFRNRDVAVVTARSCFKCFGYRIIDKGKRIRDDYFEARASQNGPQEGSDDDQSQEGDTGRSSRRMLISRNALSNEYDASTPVTSATWLHHAALAARGFNAQLYERRAEKTTFYDIHTNVMQVAAATQPTSCKFECIGGSDTTFSVAPVQFDAMSSSKTPFRGRGRDLLDGTFDCKAVMEALPKEIQPLARRIIEPSNVNLSSEKESYPIALLDGQYQESFPIHFTRFGQPSPKIARPSAVAANIQSMVAQQQYFQHMYQGMHHNMAALDRGNHTPQMAPSPVVAGGQPFGFSGPLLQPRPASGARQAQSPAHTPKQHHLVSPHYTPSPKSSTTGQAAFCSFISPNGQACRSVVSFPGEKCQTHAGKSAAGTAPKMYTDNTCASCSFLSAPKDLLPDGENQLCDPFTLIKCAKCHQKYHPVCQQLNTPRQLATVESYPWTCEDCKICCVCKSAGDESQLMMCDACDRGWHTGCCNPKMDEVPEDAWLCPLCAACHSCAEQNDKATYMQVIVPPNDHIKYPTYLINYCQKCHSNFDSDRYCPVCLKTFSEEDENDDEDNQMVMCDSCDRWVHTICDEILTPEKYQSLCDNEDAEYTCPLCENRSKPLVNTESAQSSLKGESGPSGYCIGLLGGKVRTRGVVTLKGAKLAVPEINGTGIAEMPS